MVTTIVLSKVGTEYEASIVVYRMGYLKRLYEAHNFNIQ